MKAATGNKGMKDFRYCCPGCGRKLGKYARRRHICDADRREVRRREWRD